MHRTCARACSHATPATVAVLDSQSNGTERQPQLQDTVSTTATSTQERDKGDTRAHNPHAPSSVPPTPRPHSTAGVPAQPPDSYNIYNGAPDNYESAPTPRPSNSAGDPGDSQVSAVPVDMPSEQRSLANREEAAAAHGEEAAGGQEAESVGDGDPAVKDPLERYYKLVGSAGE